MVGILAVGTLAAQKAQGFRVSKDWRNHDQSFLWAAALMQGRGDVAVAAARAIASRSKGPHAFGEYCRSLPMLVLSRLERWDALAREFMPDGSLATAQALGAGARGVGLVRSGRMSRQAALAQADAGAAAIANAHSKPNGFDRMLREMTATATERLRAEIASTQGPGRTRQLRGCCADSASPAAGRVAGRCVAEADTLTVGGWRIAVGGWRHDTRHPLF